MSDILCIIYDVFSNNIHSFKVDFVHHSIFKKINEKLREYKIKY